MPDHLQLHRRLPARDQHHAGDPRGVGRDSGPERLSASEPVGKRFHRLLIRADGAARGNPGPAAAGAVLIDASRPDARSSDAPVVASVARPLGIQTNNYAEYMAVLLALERAADLGADEVELVLDSKLVVEQLAGGWKVRHPGLAPLHARARELLARFGRWSVRHEPRASNIAADALANLALDDPAAAAAAERGATADDVSMEYGDGRRLERVEAVIERLLDSGTVVAASDGRTHRLFPVSIGRAEGQALRERVERESAASTLEVGLGYGVSALHICAGLLAAGQPQARHVVIDPHQSSRFADCGLQVLDEAGVRGMVEFHPAASELVLPRLLGEERRFDLCFVDGNHRFDGVFVDLVYLWRLVRDGGVVFVDDYQLPSVAKAVSFFTRNLGWTIEATGSTDEHHAWAVLRTASSPPKRNYDHFVDF